MTRWERLVWLASWVAPLSAWAALLAFGWYVVHGRGSIATSPRMIIWIVGALVMVAALTHLTVGLHALHSSRFAPQERSELRRRLSRGTGHSHWRRLMRQSHSSWYKGRSHSGERPRFD